MSFGHPSQQSHKLAGFAKAAKSPKTPAHLRSHLQNLSQGGTVAKAKFPGAKKFRAPSAPGPKAPTQGMALNNDSDQEDVESPANNAPMFFGAKRKTSKPRKASAFYGEM